jgi:O-antigen/teichoic acid export membrane protein
MSPAPVQPSLTARLVRGAAQTGGVFVLAQGLRFASNLILARLLFPDAFGLMALVTMVIVGLTMLSDAGIHQSILHHKRGEDPDFLNTAFTMSALRGALLWVLACALGWPLAQFYDAPDLIWFLPVAGFGLFLAGLTPTRVYSAERNILLGRILTLDLSAQTIGIGCMIALAYLLQSPWALVLGGLITALVKLVLEWSTLPGLRNRPRWERQAVRDLFHFGGWIMLSSACGFALNQGDRLILGRFLTLEELGIYNIAYFLAAFPVLLLGALNERLLIPAYREALVQDAPQNLARLHKLRLFQTGTIMALLGLAALIGPWLVSVLYDARYALAGPKLVLIACALIPVLIGATYDAAALARGDSQRFFWLTSLRAVVQITFFLCGLWLAGLPGALAGQALSAVLLYPMQAALARRYGVWDGRHDALYGLLGLGVVAGALGVHHTALLQLLP